MERKNIFQKGSTNFPNMLRALSDKVPSRQKYAQPIDLKIKPPSSRRSSNSSLKSKVSKFKKGEGAPTESTINNQMNKRRKIKVVVTEKTDRQQYFSDGQVLFENKKLKEEIQKIKRQNQNLYLSLNQERP